MPRPAIRYPLWLGAALLAACAAEAPRAPAAQAAPAPDAQAQAGTPVADAASEAGADVVAERELRVENVKPGLDVIFGPGGNIGVSSGADGVVLIDDKFAADAPGILYLVERIAGDGPSDLLFVLNTHLHGDHTGSNPEMKAAGALVMGHDNIRARMQTSYENKAFGRTVEAKGPDFLPVVTFSDRASLHFNGVTAHAIHMPAAHTDGDSIIHLVEPDAIHMGDNLFLGMFPFVDVDSGGSMQGMIAAHDAALALAGPATTIIPGHGPVTDRAGLQEARDTLQSILDRVRIRREAGDSLQSIIDADILADMADMEGFIKRPGIITAAWRSLGGDI